MFLQNQTYDVEDFLNTINFVPPRGTTIDYFIVPLQTRSPLNPEAIENEFPASLGDFQRTEPATQIVPGITDTITYTKKNANMAHSFNDANFDVYAQPGAMPKNPAKPELLSSTIQTIGGQVNSNQKLNRIMHVAEQFEGSVIYMLNENWEMFPRNTLFKCSPVRIK